MLCRRNVPIAEIRGIPGQQRERPIGLAKGEFEVLDEFFAPLPADIVESFEGRGE